METRQANRNTSGKQKHIRQTEIRLVNGNTSGIRRSENMSHENMSHENKSYENMSCEKMSYVQPHCSLTTSETPELDLVVTGSTSVFYFQEVMIMMLVGTQTRS